MAREFWICETAFTPQLFYSRSDFLTWSDDENDEGDDITREAFCVIEKSAADKLADAIENFFESEFQKHVGNIFINSSELMQALKEYRGDE